MRIHLVWANLIDLNSKVRKYKIALGFWAIIPILITFSLAQGIITYAVGHYKSSLNDIAF